MKGIVSTLTVILPFPRTRNIQNYIASMFHFYQEIVKKQKSVKTSNVLIEEALPCLKETN